MWMCQIPNTNGSCHTKDTHITHMNVSHHTYEWVTSHVWMSHIPRMNEPHHTYEYITPPTSIRHVSQKIPAPQTRMGHVTDMNESHHTHECITSPTWLCHVTQTIPTSHIWKSHVTNTNESCHTKDTLELGHTRKWMSHHTYGWVYVTPHTWMSHVTHVTHAQKIPLNLAAHATSSFSLPPRISSKLPTHTRAHTHTHTHTHKRTSHIKRVFCSHMKRDFEKRRMWWLRLVGCFKL